MALWGKKDKNQAYEAEGNAIGLTQAFAPVRDFDEYGDEGDFTAFGDPEVPEVPAVGALEEEAPKRGRHARHAAQLPVEADDEDEVYEEDFEDDEPRGRHAVGAQVAPAEDFEGEEYAEEPAEVALSVISTEAVDAGGAFAEEPVFEMPEYMRKSRRTRRVLTVAIVLLVLLLAAGGFFAWQLVQTASTSASQQVQTHEGSNDIEGSEATDASPTPTKKTTAPNLVSLMGMTEDEAVKALERGAKVASTVEVDEKDSPVKTEVRVALTAEPADSRTGTPTVYLGLNKDGEVVQAGYSTSTGSLGYGTLSFSDAVKNEHIIESTLGEIGLDVESGSVKLPEDKTEYSTYGSDGKTLVKEYCPFGGEAKADGKTYEWSAVLSYDYSTANATGNLNDTVRLIYVYVNE